MKNIQQHQETETILKDYYKKFGNGLIASFLIKVKVMGQVIMTVKFETVEANINIPDVLVKFTAE